MMMMKFYVNSYAAASIFQSDANDIIICLLSVLSKVHRKEFTNLWNVLEHVGLQIWLGLGRL